jgi:hypothetical protein
MMIDGSLDETEILVQIGRIQIIKQVREMGEPPMWFAIVRGTN